MESVGCSDDFESSREGEGEPEAKILSRYTGPMELRSILLQMIALLSLRGLYRGRKVLETCSMLPSYPSCCGMKLDSEIPPLSFPRSNRRQTRVRH